MVREATSTKINENDVGNICEVKTSFGRWITKLDIVDEQDGSVSIEKMDGHGHCGRECSIVIFFSNILKSNMFLGILLWSLFCLWGNEQLSHLVIAGEIIPLWQSSLALFILAWVGQFIGHKVEGAKPSFFEDLQFLMIGPAWLMAFIYKKLGINYKRKCQKTLGWEHQSHRDTLKKME